MIESLISDTQSLQNKLKAYWSARPIEALASMREGGIVYLHLYHKRENCQCWNTRLVWPSLKRLKQVLITRLLRPFNLPTYTTNNYDILDTFDTLIPLQWSCETDSSPSHRERIGKISGLIPHNIPHQISTSFTFIAVQPQKKPERCPDKDL